MGIASDARRQHPRYRIFARVEAGQSAGRADTQRHGSIDCVFDSSNSMSKALGNRFSPVAVPGRPKPLYLRIELS